MNNETYLVLSYFTVGVGCILLARMTYALLRRSFTDLSRTVPGGKLGLILRRVFPLSLFLFVMAGFLSVSFRSCTKESYAKVIADRSYLLAKNQEQFGTSLRYICIALLIWALLLAISFAFLKRDHQKKR